MWHDIWCVEGSDCGIHHAAFHAIKQIGIEPRLNNDSRFRQTSTRLEYLEAAAFGLPQWRWRRYRKRALRPQAHSAIFPLIEPRISRSTIESALLTPFRFSLRLFPRGESRRETPAPPAWRSCPKLPRRRRGAVRNDVEHSPLAFLSLRAFRF